MGGQVWAPWPPAPRRCALQIIVIAMPGRVGALHQSACWLLSSKSAAPGVDPPQGHNTQHATRNTQNTTHTQTTSTRATAWAAPPAARAPPPPERPPATASAAIETAARYRAASYQSAVKWAHHADTTNRRMRTLPAACPHAVRARLAPPAARSHRLVLSCDPRARLQPRPITSTDAGGLLVAR